MPVRCFSLTALPNLESGRETVCRREPRIASQAMQRQEIRDRNRKEESPNTATTGRGQMLYAKES